MRVVKGNVTSNGQYYYCCPGCGCEMIKGGKPLNDEERACPLCNSEFVDDIGYSLEVVTLKKSS